VDVITDMASPEFLYQCHGQRLSLGFDMIFESYQEPKLSVRRAAIHTIPSSVRIKWPSRPSAAEVEGDVGH